VDRDEGATVITIMWLAAVAVVGLVAWWRLRIAHHRLLAILTDYDDIAGHGHGAEEVGTWRS
jgi:hypothetical protein